MASARQARFRQELRKLTAAGMPATKAMRSSGVRKRERDQS